MTINNPFVTTTPATPATGWGTCDRCGATCTGVTLAKGGHWVCESCTRAAVAAEARRSWLMTGYITLTATTQSGTRYTVWKRPGKPTVVIHPDGNVYRGTLIVAFGTDLMIVNSRGQEILHTTPVTDVYVLEN